MMLNKLLEISRKDKLNLKKIQFTEISPLWLENPLSDSMFIKKVTNGFYNYTFRRNIDDYYCLVSSLIEKQLPKAPKGSKILEDTNQLRLKRSKLLYSVLNEPDITNFNEILENKTLHKISEDEFTRLAFRIVKRGLNDLYVTNRKKEPAYLSNLYKHICISLKTVKLMREYLKYGGLVRYKKLINDFDEVGIKISSNFVFLERDIWIHTNNYSKYIQNINSEFNSEFKYEIYYGQNTAHSSIEYFPEAFEQFF